MWSLIAATHGLVATAPIAGVGARALAGVGSLPLASGGGSVDLGEALQAPGTSLVVLGTYPADFNMIEYAQRLRYYLPALRAKGVSRVLCTVNGKPSSVERLSEMLELPAEIELLADESGEAGRAFGCSRGWRPDDASLSPYAKLLGMLIGLGAWRTLPAVITGYLGNPGGKHGWIEAALAQGQRAGRPTFNGIILDLDGDGKVRRSAFDELPLVGGWGRRPLELATLRLQTMLGADKSAFQLYQSGVIDSASCGKELDHGVLVVGYGTDTATGKDYWKIKNSWGGTWGEEGFVRVVQGKNMCGIASQASYPKGVHMAAPTPPTPPGPPPKTTTHYGDPKAGCLSDEIEVQVQGLGGDFCSSACSLFKPCPTDVPSSVTAKPMCALKEAGTLKEYCALVCAPAEDVVDGQIRDQKKADGACGASASCKMAGAGVGICTYDD